MTLLVAKHVDGPRLIERCHIGHRRCRVDHGIDPAEQIRPLVGVQGVAAANTPLGISHQIDTTHLDALGNQSIVDVPADEATCTGDQDSCGHRHGVNLPRAG